MNNLRRQRLTAWIAMFAILLAALAPGVSQALASASSQPSPWSEICSATGLTHIATATTETPADPQGGGWHRQCPFCQSHADAFALPVTSALGITITTVADRHTAAAEHTPPARINHLRAQPRAPPAVS